MMVDHQDQQWEIDKKIIEPKEKHDSPGGFKAPGFETVSQAEKMLAGTSAYQIMETLAIKARANLSSLDKYAGDISLLGDLGLIETYNVCGETRVGLTESGEEYVANQIVKKPEAERVLAQIKKDGNLDIEFMEMYHKELSVMESLGILDRDISSETYTITKDYLGKI